MSAVIEASKSLSEMNWNFFQAITHTDAGLQYSHKDAFLQFGRTLSSAELSVFASQFSIARDFLENSTSDFLMFCEDDLFIDPFFDFQAVAELLAHSKIDYLRLYARALTPVKQLLSWGRFQLVRFTWTPGGAQCYIYSRQGAERLVDHVLKTGLIMRPIDAEMERYWEVGNPIYGLHPWPVLEKNLVSTISNNAQIEGRKEGLRELENDNNDRAVQKKLSKMSRLKVGRVVQDPKRERIEKKLYEMKLKSADRKVQEAARKFLQSGKANKFNIEMR